MSYQVKPEALVPMLAKCIARHGDIESVRAHITTVSARGEDATVCPEFIATREIDMRHDRTELITKAEALAMHYRAEKETNPDPKGVPSHSALQALTTATRRFWWIIPYTVSFLVTAAFAGESAVDFVEEFAYGDALEPLSFPLGVLMATVPVVAQVLSYDGMSISGWDEEKFFWVLVSLPWGILQIRILSMLLLPQRGGR